MERLILHHIKNGKSGREYKVDNKVWPCEKYYYSSCESHYGVDITGISGHDYNVVSVCDGVVIATSGTRAINPSVSYADRNQRRTSAGINDGGGYGNYIIIQEPSTGRCFLYAHLRGDSITVNKGDSVSAGQAIAVMGSSGDSGHMNVHFEIRKDIASTIKENGEGAHYLAIANPNTNVDPEQFIGSAPQVETPKEEEKVEPAPEVKDEETKKAEEEAKAKLEEEERAKLEEEAKQKEEAEKNVNEEEEAQKRAEEERKKQEYEDVKLYIRYIYRKVLGRNPMLSEANHCLDRYKENGDIPAITKDIFVNDETAAMTNYDFMSKIIEILYNRNDVKTNIIEAYAGVIDRGEITREDFVVGVCSTQNFKENMYQTLVNLQKEYESKGKYIAIAPGKCLKVLGDLDGDGTITMIDASLCMALSSLEDKTFYQYAVPFADVDGDGIVEREDAQLILDYYIGTVVQAVDSNLTIEQYVQSKK